MLERQKIFIKDHYGSKRGLLRLKISLLKDKLGYWSEYKNIDWDKVQSLVFICMGNICRSPLGEIIAQSHSISTRSYGLTAPNGDPADPRAIEFAKNLSLDLSLHETTSISDAAFFESDLVITMEPQHFQHEHFPKDIPAQKTLLGLWHDDYRPYLHDPYNTNEKYFNHCESIVTEATKNIIKNVTNNR